MNCKIGFVCILCFAALTLPCPGLVGDTIVLNDNPSGVTLSQVGSSRLVDPIADPSICTPVRGAEVECFAVFAAGIQPTTFTASFVWIGEGSSPDNVSDFEIGVSLNPLFSNAYFVELISFDPALPLSCSAVGGCAIDESGSQQHLQTIAWSNDTSDDIEFIATPEPSSICLLGLGISVVLGRSGRNSKRLTI